MPRNLPRITGVTAGLLLAGSITGALLAAGVLAAVGLVLQGPRGLAYSWQNYALAGAIGALLGGVGLPLVTWGFLRHVALGRVVLETALGTIIGGVVGLLASHLRPLPAAEGALAGFLLAAVQLRVRRPKRGNASGAAARSRDNA